MASIKLTGGLILFSLAFTICFIFSMAPSVVHAAAFDTFDNQWINRDNWRNQERYRGVDNASLVMGVRKYTDITGRYKTETLFVAPETINKIQTTVTVIAAELDPSITEAYHQEVSADINGTYYSDANGDVEAGVAIVDFNDGAGLRAGCYMNTSVETGPGSGSDHIFEDPANPGSNFPIEKNHPYILTIEFNPVNSKFTCTIKDGTSSKTQSHDLLFPLPMAGPATSPSKALLTDYSIENETDGTFNAEGFSAALFDDVEINDTLYDDFSSSPLDPAKWNNREYARSVNENRLLLAQHSYGDTRETCRIRTASSVQGTDFYQVDVTIDGQTNILGSGARGQAIIGGYFYNDLAEGGNNGMEGDHYARVSITQYSSGSLLAQALIWRCNNADCSLDSTLWYEDFTVAPLPDVEQTLSIQFQGNSILFTAQDEQITYPIPGNIYKPSLSQRRLTTRVYSVTGQSSTMGAFFDNIFFNEEEPFSWAMFLPAIESAATQNSK